MNLSKAPIFPIIFTHPVITNLITIGYPLTVKDLHEWDVLKNKSNYFRSNYYAIEATRRAMILYEKSEKKDDYSSRIKRVV